MSSPTVAVIGSTGYVGKLLMVPFLEALKQGKLKELRILTSSDKIGNEAIRNYVKDGAKAVPVNYEEPATVTSAFQGVDVVVSALGTSAGNIKQVQKVLLDAMVASKVKLYFPSEFGTNHYKLTLPLYMNHPVFKDKHDHFLEAKKRGLNPIRMLIGDILEASFGSWFGLDCNSGVWTVVGNGADTLCAMTAERDIGKFTLEALLKAHSNPGTVPDQLEVYSDMRTLKEYAAAFDSVSGKTTKFVKVPLDQFKKEFESTQVFEKLIQLMFAEGTYDHSKSTANSLLNPNESLWKLKKVEEYAQETGGIPWKA